MAAVSALHRVDDSPLATKVSIPRFSSSIHLSDLGSPKSNLSYWDDPSSPAVVDLNSEKVYCFDSS
jgi:hypothetical protein